MDPKASIIVITCNQADSIAAALESVVGQRCDFPYEVVIGDDSSSDGTRSICEDYARKYPDIIRLLSKGPNKGIVGNYFSCLAACRGEYVGDCAGDDAWVAPDRLQRQADFLDNNPKCAAVISDWLIVTGKSTTLSSDIPSYSAFRQNLPGSRMRDLTLGCTDTFPFLSAMLFRRKPIADILVHEPDHIMRTEWGCEDLPIITALSGIGDIGYLPLTASRYNVGDSTTNSRDAGRTFDFYVKAANCIADLCNIYSIEPERYSHALSRRLDYLSSLALEAGGRNRSKQLSALYRRLPGIPSMKARIYRLAAINTCTRKALLALKHLLTS